ncbi:unnamed protein product, partial [Ectocarpus sp. 4 AP-2014]
DEVITIRTVLYTYVSVCAKWVVLLLYNCKGILFCLPPAAVERVGFLRVPGARKPPTSLHLGGFETRGEALPSGSSTSPHTVQRPPQTTLIRRSELLLRCPRLQ